VQILGPDLKPIGSFSSATRQTCWNPPAIEAGDVREERETGGDGLAAIEQAHMRGGRSWCARLVLERYPPDLLKYTCYRSRGCERGDRNRWGRASGH
jgi:hypothetical protein